LSFHQTGEHIPLMKIAPAQAVLPLYRDDARALFDAEMALLKWRELPIGVGERKFNPTEVHQAHLLAQEFGEDGLSAKLAEFSDARFGPTWDVATAEFTWRFGLDEEHPRGQLNATAAMAEAGGPDAWWGIVNRPNRKKLAEPTVHGVDFPKVCLSQAVYDPSAAQLIIATDDGVPAHRGEPTTFRISNVVPGNCSVEIDGTKSDNWRIVEGQIEISTTVGNHTVVVRCG
jgi:hypothetical protein